MEELKIGDIIKQRYTLVQFLGSGSFGEVWLAHDQMTDRDVALKIYLSLDPAGVEEFQREYANSVGLSSPYLLTPDYFDIHNRRPFLVMKFCENGSSSKLAGQISEDKLWAFIHDVASGLEVLHSQSDPIVHQDIKPDNILIDSTGRFLITDFGISKRLRATLRRQSKRDVSSGAMPYMAPERFDSKPRLSTASDIWSLGASIYELATRELPFSGFGGAMQRNGADIPSLDRCFSSALNEIMQRCLNPAAANRPTALELSKWAKSKTIPAKTSEDSHKTIAKQSATIQEPKSQNASVKSSPHSTTLFVLIALAILVGIAIFVWSPFNSDNVGKVTSQSVITDSIAEKADKIQSLTAEQQIINSSCVTKDGQSIHFYKGAFYYENDIYPVMVAFIVADQHIQKVIYKNVTYGGRIAMSCHSQDNEILLSGKDGNNNFTMLLSAGDDNRLLGTAVDGNKSMTVRLMPTDESFDIFNTSLDKEIMISEGYYNAKYEIHCSKGILDVTETISGEINKYQLKTNSNVDLEKISDQFEGLVYFWAASEIGANIVNENGTYSDEYMRATIRLLGKSADAFSIKRGNSPLAYEGAKSRKDMLNAILTGNGDNSFDDIEIIVWGMGEHPVTTKDIKLD